MNGRITPFENGPALAESERLGSATLVDVRYDEPARAPHMQPRVAGNVTGGAAPVARTTGQRATGPQPTAAPQVQSGWESEDEIDTRVMGPRHIAPAQAPAEGAAFELDWDIDDSNTEKWQPRHSAPARKVPPRSTSGVRPATHPTHDPRSALRGNREDPWSALRGDRGVQQPQAVRQPKAVQPAVAVSPEDVIEELREQLIEVLERARISEARAVAAERRAEEADKGGSALGALRNQLSSAIERARASEAAQAAAEWRADASEQDAQAALQRLSEQLNEQVEASGAQIDEALQRAQLAEQTVQHARSERQLVEETMARALSRAATRSSLLFGLSVVLLLGCAVAGYFLLYAPLQQRMAAQQALQVQEATRHSQELASLQRRLDSERQEFEASRRQAEAQPTAAGAVPAGRAGSAAAALSEKSAANAKADKASAATESKQTMSATRAAPPAHRGQ